MPSTLDTTDRATPTGKPEKRDALLLLALLTLSDLESAERWWGDNSPDAFHGMLLGRNGWRWDDQRQLYVGRAGHKVDGGDMKHISLLVAAAAEMELRQAASNMATGMVPINQWQADVADLLKRVHVTQGALASGGFAKLADSPALRERITGTPDAPPGLAFSLDRLAKFGEDVAEGKPRNDTEAGIVERASMYGDASNSTYEDVRRESHKDAKDEQGRSLYLYEKNLLGPSDHCRDTEQSEGCWEISKLGWVPIGTLVPIGARTCRAMCKCSLAFNLIGPAEEN